MVEKKEHFSQRVTTMFGSQLIKAFCMCFASPCILIPRMNVLSTTKRVTFLHKTAFLNYRDFQEKGLGPPLLLVRGLVVE